jgi:hypothetical protein
MKKLFIFTTLMLMTFASFTQKTCFYTAIDGLAPAAKIGIEYRFTERWSLTASGGTCVIGPELISYNLFATYITSNPEKPFYFSINFGLMDNYVVYNKNSYSFNFSIEPGIGYQFKNMSRLSLRLGWIVGLQYEEGKIMNLDIPNYALAFSIPFKKTAK